VIADWMPEEEARGAFDVRVRVVAETEAEAWELIAEFVELAREVAPEGVEVAYFQLRPPSRSRDFRATMTPAGRRPARAPFAQTPSGFSRV
jgi:hypothetical protein